MNRSILRPTLLVGAGLATLFVLSACSDYDSGTVHGSVGMYYGTGGYYNPWYYGPAYGPPVIVAPPRPPVSRPPPPRPAPLPARPAPRPMPRGR